MGYQTRGCVGYVLIFNIFIVSAILGTAIGWVGWVMPTVFIAVAFMFVHMILDVILLLMGYDLNDGPDMKPDPNSTMP